MRKTLIKNGKVYDGTTNEPVMADVLVKDDLIAEIRENIEASDDMEVIDAAGLCVCPGFIDPHTHNDFIFARQKDNIHGLSQGVTTQIVGLCGLGPVPANENIRKNGMKLYSGIFGDLCREPCDWETLPQYFEKAAGAQVNAAVAISHCALRIYFAGYKSRPYDKELADQMKGYLDKAMEEGAVGLSTGLDYYPARISKTAEMVDLCEPVKKHGGVFMIHLRPFPDEYDPMEEAFVIAKQSGVKTHLLHTKTYYPVSSGHPESITDAIEAARADGCDVTSEFYPYHAFASLTMAFLPSWALEGDHDAVMKILSDESIREKLIKDTEKGYTDFMIGATPAWFTNVGGHPEYEGRSFCDVAAERGQTEAEMIVDVLREADLQVCMVASEPSDPEIRKTLEDDYMTLLGKDYYTIGSDSIDSGGRPHPRACGTFTRMIRQSKDYDIPLEKVINKITLFNAERFGFTDRGRLEAGKAADITIFDYDTITDNATYAEPQLLSEGIEYVLVNGALALKKGKSTNACAGRAIKKGN